MRTQATLTNGQQAFFVSRTGGWTTLADPVTGAQTKVRNSLVATLTELAETPVAKAEKATKAPRVTREKLPTDERKNGVVPAKYLGNYHRHNLGNGLVVVDNGDRVAQLLRGKTLDETYDLVAKTTHTNGDDLWERYQGLNEGQQRMCLGNRLRGFFKREEARLAAEAAAADEARLAAEAAAADEGDE